MIEITAASRVVVQLPRAEVGQGITTAMAQIVAEELDARLADVDVVLDDARPELLFNQLTGGSNSIHALYGPMRTVGRRRPGPARHRRRPALAVAPAATLAPATPRSSPPTGAPPPTASLSAAAAAVTVPAVPPAPKDPDDFTVDRPADHAGSTPATSSPGGPATPSTSTVPGALPSVVARPPTIGGTVRTVDDTAARAHARRRGRDPHPERRRRRGRDVRPGAGRPRRAGRHWDPGPERRPVRRARSRAAAQRPTPPFVLPPLGSLTVDRTFEFAFVPHAPLEVLNCVADVRADRAELWLPSKSPIVAAQSVAAALGLPADRVTLHVVRGGGSFGRRLFFDPAIEAAQVSKAVGRPVRLMWTRGRRHAPRPDAARPATTRCGPPTCWARSSPTSTAWHSVALDFSHGLGEALTAVGRRRARRGRARPCSSSARSPLRLRRRDPVC